MGDKSDISDRMDEIGYSKIENPSLDDLMGKYRNKVIDLAKAKVKIKELEKINGHYESMKVWFGVEDYWNTYLKYAEDIIYIVNKAPKWISLLVKLIQIIELIKESVMNGKWFNIVTTVFGLGYFIWEGIMPVLQGNWTWEGLISAAITAILAYFAQKKSVKEGIMKTFKRAA